MLETLLIIAGFLSAQTLAAFLLMREAARAERAHAAGVAALIADSRLERARARALLNTGAGWL